MAEGKTEVYIPVTFYATYDDSDAVGDGPGRITKLVVMPRESDAGYFGPGSEVIEGDNGLDVKDTDGPFWRAMQSALGSVPIEWEE